MRSYFVMELIILAPSSPCRRVADATQVISASLSIVEKRLIELVELERNPKLWSLLDRAARENGTATRHEMRQRRLRLWAAVPKLVQIEVMLRTANNRISLASPFLPKRLPELLSSP